MNNKRMIEHDFNNINIHLERILNEVFKDKDRDSLTNLEKRKLIFDYLVNNNDYDFNLLNDILSSGKRYPAEEIYSILEGMEKGRGIGVCNAFSYIYKLLLEKCGIPSMLMLCELRENDISELEQKGLIRSLVKRGQDGKFIIDHMFILVQNDNGTYSFDDPTCAILDRDKGINYFNYDLRGCVYRNQYDMKGFPSDFIEAIIGRNNPPEADREMSRRYDSSRTDGFLNLPDNIEIFVDREGDKSKNEIE